MNRIEAAETVGPGVRRIVIDAPRIAAAHRAGQFVIVRPTETSERIPLTIAASDPSSGTITLYVQAVGRTTSVLNALPAGATVADLAGPLGMPSDVQRFGTVVVVGGGLGTAIVYPTARALAAADNEVVAVVGGRTAEHVLLEEELAAVCSEVRVCTDDGSAGRHGFVTDELFDLLGALRVDRVFVAGPVPMMAAVSAMTRAAGIPTVASLNPIMVDGTGMCGGCRVEVGGQTRFACVDGPEFDAHAVDFDLLDRRNRAYREFEERARSREPSCQN